MDEWPNWLFLLVRLLVAAAVCGSFFYVGLWLSDGKVIGGVGFMMLSVPAIGVALAKPIVLLAHEGMSWLWQKPMEAWQGSYYSFNDMQVRVYEFEDELWFVVPDVVRAVGMKSVPQSFRAIYPKGSRILPGTRLSVMNRASLENLLGKRNEHEAIRFLNWMRREVVKPWERKREKL